MININKHNPSFGWHYPMHKKILTAVLDNAKIPHYNEITRILRESVQKPDLDEFFLYGQSHFYYPKDIIKSYLDITGTHNAKAAYKKHLSKMDKYLSCKAAEPALDEAGRALHYLQDMAQPNHIQSGSIIRKAIDKKMHADFEMSSFAIQDKLLNNANPPAVNSADFDTLFKDTIELSLPNKFPSSNNVSEWGNIAQKGIDTAVGSTKRFLELLAAKLQ